MDARRFGARISGVLHIPCNYGVYRYFVAAVGSTMHLNIRTELVDVLSIVS